MKLNFTQKAELEAVRLNPGGGSGPFLVVDLGSSWMTLEDPAEIRSLAGQLLDGAGELEAALGARAAKPEQLERPGAGDGS